MIIFIYSWQIWQLESQMNCQSSYHTGQKRLLLSWTHLVACFIRMYQLIWLSSYLWSFKLLLFLISAAICILDSLARGSLADLRKTVSLGNANAVYLGIWNLFYLESNPEAPTAPNTPTFNAHSMYTNLIVPLPCIFSRLNTGQLKMTIALLTRISQTSTDWALFPCYLTFH